MTYKALFPNNLIVAEIDNRLFVIDTGSPLSFTFDANCSVVINTETYELRPPFGVTQEDVKTLTRLSIDGLIGIDILGDTNITIDRKIGEIVFDCVKSYMSGTAIGITVRSTLGQALVFFDSLNIEGHISESVILDTGAGIQYISPSFLNPNSKTNETYNDVSPMLGNISGYFYNVSMGLGSNDQIIKAGEMPILLQMLAEGIINPLIFDVDSVVLDFTNGKAYLI